MCENNKRMFSLEQSSGNLPWFSQPLTHQESSTWSTSSATSDSLNVTSKSGMAEQDGFFTIEDSPDTFNQSSKPLIKPFKSPNLEEMSLPLGKNQPLKCGFVFLD